MKKILTFLAAVTLSTAAFADSHCDQMVPFGYPQTQVTDTTQLCRIAYTVNHDNARKVPVYSAEFLLPENFKGKNKRVNAFKADPDLHPTQRADLNDYDKKYDRGHMTPFEDTKANPVASLQTFYLSNMVPQDLHLNRGMWRTIENRTRNYVDNAGHGLYVITGPVFDGKPKTIGEGVAVPTRLYKVVIDKESMQGIAFLVPNSSPKAGDSYDKFITTITEVERVTGINFTPTLKNTEFKNVVGKEFK